MYKFRSIRKTRKTQCSIQFRSIKFNRISDQSETRSKFVHSKKKIVTEGTKTTKTDSLIQGASYLEKEEEAETAAIDFCLYWNKKPKQNNKLKRSTTSSWENRIAKFKKNKFKKKSGRIGINRKLQIQSEAQNRRVLGAEEKEGGGKWEKERRGKWGLKKEEEEEEF